MGPSIIYPSFPPSLPRSLSLPLSLPPSSPLPVSHHSILTSLAYLLSVSATDRVLYDAAQ